MSEIMELLPAIYINVEAEKTSYELTKREKELMQMIANGYTSSDMAEKLFLSTNTIESHRRNIFKKLQTGNIAEAIAYCFRNKIIE
jgi:DNA-binding NarL/FixJ family response regulator